MRIDQLRLRGRWTSVAALEHYIQEAAAFVVRNHLSGKAKLFVQSRSQSLWNVVLAAIAELANSHAHASVSDNFDVHPIMKRLLRKQKMDELRKLAEKF